MRTNTLALSLTLVASLLVACGGDVRSPDRPSSRLDPDSLRIKFTPGKQLPGTGNSSISVRMLATQTNGVEVNLGPELNVTEDTQWDLSGAPESLELANLASEIRDAGQLRNVLDILSTVRLESTDSVKNLTITGQYSFEGTQYNITEPFTIVPPIAVFDKYIAGQTVIAFNPSNSTASTTENYQLLQKLEGVAQPENSTENATFCSDNVNFVFGVTQNSDSGATIAPATITNPFTTSNQTQVAVKISAIELGVACTAPDSDKNTIATLIVNIIPATVSSLAVCAVANPADDVCSGNLSNQRFFNEQYLSDCKGLDNTTIKLPAAQRLQLIAELIYTNPQNFDQPPFIAYQCSGPSVLAWSASPTAIFSEGPDKTDGDASLISRQDYEALPEADLTSTVTATYTNDIGTVQESTISDSLDLLLINAEVEAVTIMRDDDVTPANGTDTIFLNVFNEGIDYTAMCTFINLDSTETITCPDALVSWEVDKPTILKVDPAETSNNTTVSPVKDTTGFGSVILTALYSGGLGDITATRTIDANNDDVAELHLYQEDANAAAPDNIGIDEFSCVGRTDLVGTLDDGETYIRGNQQFRAFVLLESGKEAMTPEFLAKPTLAGSPLIEVTDREKLVFTSIPGYWSGNDSEPPSCQSSLNQEVDTPNTPAASFGETKGSLESRGLLRLSTVCIQAFIDSDSDGFTDGDVVAEEGSTVLVLPSANDELLIFSNNVCEAFESEVGPPNQQALELAYTFSTIADPILSALATNDDGGAIPVEAIIQALITGNFSTIDQGFPNSPEGGLGRVTSEVLGAAAE
jgi:hypothetical protein